MPTIEKMPSPVLEQNYADTLKLFIVSVEETEADDKLGDPEFFISLLSWGLQLLGPAADLSRDEKIAKTTISKWLNSGVVPAAPTRKVVFNWFKARAEKRLESSPGESKERHPARVGLMLDDKGGKLATLNRN